MYENFTDRARKVMQLANQEAQRLNHEYVGTEHILLGLVLEGVGVGANVLKNLNIDLRKIRLEVEKIVLSGPDYVTTGRLPQTPRAKKVIEHSIEEARNLNHNYVGTEHLLLGLLREREGIAAQVLINLGVSLEAVRDEILKLLQPNDTVYRPDGTVYPPGRRGPRRMKEYDLYLPLQYPDGTPIEPEKSARVRQRLQEEFGSVAGFQGGHEGAWRTGGVTFQGKVTILSVVAEPGPAARTFFERLMEDLKAELRRDEILVVVRNVEIL